MEGADKVPEGVSESWHASPVSVDLPNPAEHVTQERIVADGLPHFPQAVDDVSKVEESHGITGIGQ